jgi:hypothetical protein
MTVGGKTQDHAISCPFPNRILIGSVRMIKPRRSASVTANSAERWLAAPIIAASMAVKAPAHSYFSPVIRAFLQCGPETGRMSQAAVIAKSPEQ